MRRMEDASTVATTVDKRMKKDDTVYERVFSPRRCDARASISVQRFLNFFCEKNYYWYVICFCFGICACISECANARNLRQSSTNEGNQTTTEMNRVRNYKFQFWNWTEWQEIVYASFDKCFPFNELQIQLYPLMQWLRYCRKLFSHSFSLYTLCNLHFGSQLLLLLCISRLYRWGFYVAHVFFVCYFGFHSYTATKNKQVEEGNMGKE